MNPASTQPAAVQPEDPVRTALEDPSIQDKLVEHALAILGRTLAARPLADRVDRAREAVQETSLRALQKGKEHDPSRPVGPWLHGILNNVVRETTRALRHAPSQESAEEDNWQRVAVALGSDPAEVVADRVDLVGYLAKLAPEHREMLRLRFTEALSHEEIAARLGTSPGNARVRLCRALYALKVIAGVAPAEDRP